MPFRTRQVSHIYLTCFLHGSVELMREDVEISCDRGVEVEEGEGDRTGEVAGYTVPARDADKYAGERELQCGDDGGDEEGVECTQGYPWEAVRFPSFIPTVNYVQTDVYA